jgi:hypothetical protein
LTKYVTPIKVRGRAVNSKCNTNMVTYNSVGIVTRLVWTTEESWLDSREGQEILQFARISTPDMGSTWLPTVTAGAFPGENKPQHEFDHSLPSSAEVMNAWGHNFTPPVLSWLP